MFVWSLFKKLGRHNKVGGQKHDYSLLIDKMVVPTHMVRNEKTYELIHVDDSYIIDGFIINYFMNSNIPKVTSISIFGGMHPNADRNTRIFCVPEYMKYKELNKIYMNDVRKMMQIWNLDNCHYVPNPHDYKTR